MHTTAPLLALMLFASPLPAQEVRPADFHPTRLEARSDSFAVFAGGAPIGGQRLTLERVEEGWTFTESTEITGRMEQRTTVLFADDLTPLSVRQAGTAMGDSMGVAIDYARGRVTGTARTPSPEGHFEERTLDLEVPAGVVDDNMLQALLVTLPWSPSAAWRIAVFSAGRGEVLKTILQVTGVETVEVPAGTFEAYRLELRREDAPVAFWITTAAPHRVVKVGSLVAPIEFVLVGTESDRVSPTC